MAVKRYDGSAWQTVAGLGAQGAAATSSSIATWVKTASGGETSLSGNDDNSQALSYTVGQELLFINGVLQKRGVDYTATTGTTITGLSALTANDIATVWTVNAFSVTGAIANTIVDAKGDILVGTGADTPGRLAVGTDGQYLKADSTTGTGLAWTALSSGKTWTLLNAGGTALTGAATITVSGISNVEDLMIFVVQASSANASSLIALRFNGDTAANYGNVGFDINPSSTYSASSYGIQQNTANDRFNLTTMSSNAGSQVTGGVWVSGGKSTGIKAIIGNAGASAAGGSSQSITSQIGFYSASAAITSVSAVSSSGNFDNGTLYVYGA